MIITSVAAFVLEDGSEQYFDGSSIIVEPQYYPRASTYAVKLRVVLSGSVDVGMVDYHLTIPKADVDAKTGTGTGDTAKMLNAVEQVVVDYLEAITANASTTFTIV